MNLAWKLMAVLLFVAFPVAGTGLKVIANAGSEWLCIFGAENACG